MTYVKKGDFFFCGAYPLLVLVFEIDTLVAPIPKGGVAG